MKVVRFCEDYFNHYKNWLSNHLIHRYKQHSKYLYFPGMYLNPTLPLNISNDDFFILVFSQIVPEGLVSRAKDFLRYYKDNENFIRQSSKFYRDNLPHMIKVAIIGHKILNLKFDLFNNRRLIDYLIEITKFDEKTILRIWFLASLFHDFGYPTIIMSQPTESRVKDVIENSTKFEGTTPLNLIHYKQFIKDLKPYLKNKKVIKEIKNYIPNGCTNDHGVYSSYMLYRAMKEENLNDPLSLDIVMNACRMILFHTCFEYINWEDQFLNIEDYPLDFYLYLIDKMHECGRKVLNKKTPNEINLLDLIEYQDISYRNNQIISEYSYLNKKSLENAEFDYHKHKKDKIDTENRRIIFLKMFNKQNFLFPNLKFVYKYLDLSTDEIFNEEGYF